MMNIIITIGIIKNINQIKIIYNYSCYKTPIMIIIIINYYEHTPDKKILLLLLVQPVNSLV